MRYKVIKSTVGRRATSVYCRFETEGKILDTCSDDFNGIMWRDQNLLFDPPGADFTLVFLRNNLLTYYEDALKVPAFQKVSDSLAQGGFLVIGAHEKIPPGFRGLLPFGHHPYIFQKEIAGPAITSAIHKPQSNLFPSHPTPLPKGRGRKKFPLLGKRVRV